MICPICGSFSNNKNRCSECGSDISEFSKIYDISDKLYNKGLSYAMANDFTRAQEVLEKSILFNKNNVNARNVLGLVYYETGMISLSLKQWVISSNISKENNPAIEYVEYFQRNSKELQNMNESLKIYNQSVRSAKQKSEDMAIIQLKKAVDLNPKFILALNLLSFCYMRENDNEKALDIIKKVLSIDATNPQALSYFKELCPDGTRLVESIKIVKTNKAYDEPVKFEPKISRKVRDSRRSKIMEMIIFLAGCICTAAAMFIFIFPGVANEKQEEIDTINSDMMILQNKYEEEKAKNNENNFEEVAKENESLRLEIANYQKQTEIRSTEDQLISASALSEKKSYSEAVAIIDTINVNNLSGEKLDEYNQLKEKVYKEESSNLLKEGTKLVTSKKYQEAKEILDKALLYAVYDEKTKLEVMYYLGKALKELGDTVKAKEYFSQVAENYNFSQRRHNFKNWAKNELNSL